MGGSSTKIIYNNFNCKGDQIPPKEPIKFTNLKHIRCMFFTQDSYDAKLHIPKSLTLEFDSTILNLENDIEDNIKNVYNKMNEQSGTYDAKILSPIYVAFSRKLEHSKSVFDDPALKKIEIKELNNYSLAISDYMNSWFISKPDEQLEKKYKSLPMNIYNFNNNKIKVIVYIPFMTMDFKYITNFTDIINSTSFLVQVLLDTSFNGLPNVNTFNESKIRKNFEKTNEIRKKNNQNLLSSQEIDYVINRLKTGDNTNFRLSDDLMYLCNEGGCISENAGEDFNNLLPSLATTDSDNDNNAINMSPFLANKCLAQTVRFKCGIINADPNNSPMGDVIKAEPIIDYITENLRKYKINSDCLTLNKDDKSKEREIKFCQDNADKNPNFNQTPVDIINAALSYQLRNQYNSDFNQKENKDKKIAKYNHYSKDYSTNIIKELMLLRNKYPGIQEIVFPLYKYIGSNNYLIDPPWGSLFLTANHIIFYNEAITKQTKKYSFNNQYYLKMNNKGYIYVKRESDDQIIYYLSIIEFTKPLSMSLSNTISISFKDNISGYEKNKTVLSSSIKLINKTDKLREPYNFYLNDDGKLRVFANGFLDATDKSFITYIDDKINEYNNLGNNPEYYNKNNYDNKNNLNINSLNMNSYNPDSAIYIDKNI